MAAETPIQSWYWCLRHGRPEPGDQRCQASDILGPYGSREEASSWKDKVEERNESWDEQDLEWSGDGDDA